MNNKENKIGKYMTLYMSLGMCFGVSAAIIFSSFFSPDNISIGLCFGIPIGMFIGMGIGRAKDKRLSKNIMIIRKIEVIYKSTDVLVYVTDKNGIEKKYRVTQKKMKEEKLVEGDRVGQEINGSLVSLESK